MQARTTSFSRFQSSLISILTGTFLAVPSFSTMDGQVVSQCLEGEVDRTVHVAVFRVTETLQRSLSWSLSLISARTNKQSSCINPSSNCITLEEMGLHARKSPHRAGKNSRSPPVNRSIVLVGFLHERKISPSTTFFWLFWLTRVTAK